MQTYLLNKKIKRLKSFHSLSFKVNFMKYFNCMKLNLVEKTACTQVTILFLSTARISINKGSIKTKNNL